MCARTHVVGDYIVGQVNVEDVGETGPGDR